MSGPERLTNAEEERWIAERARAGMPRKTIDALFAVRFGRRLGLDSLERVIGRLRGAPGATSWEVSYPIEHRVNGPWRATQ